MSRALLEPFYIGVYNNYTGLLGCIQTDGAYLQTSYVQQLTLPSGLLPLCWLIGEFIPVGSYKQMRCYQGMNQH